MRMILLVLLFISACAYPIKETSTPKENLVNIYLERTKANHWFVVYRARNPVKKLRFNRNLNRFRHDVFKTISEGFRIFEENKREYIEKYDGSAFSEVSLTFESYFESLPKDYEFFQPFTDGSVVVYTGHLNVADEDTDNTINSFQFKNYKNEIVFLDGRIFNIQREDPYIPHERGTYVYFGNIKPITNSTYSAILDPQLPSWLKKDLEKIFTNIFSYYSKQTKAKPSFKPFLFLNYKDIDDPSHEGHVGGTLPGLVQATLSGAGWKSKSTSKFIDLIRFFAHEAAHIWNGQIFPYDASDVWMHEGGADAFAYRYLRYSKIISNDQYKELLSTALNECLLRLKDRPLEQVTEDRSLRVYYYCGSTLALMTEKTLQNQKRGDLFNFWQSLFVLTQKTLYTEKMYLSLLDQEYSSGHLSSFMRSFIHGPMLLTASKLVEEIQALGIRIEKTNSPAQQIQAVYGREALRALQQADCNGDYSLTQTKDGFFMKDLQDCQGFRDKTTITHINNYSLLKKGFEALLYINRVCRTDKTVMASNESTKTEYTVRCPTKTIAYTQPYKIF